MPTESSLRSERDEAIDAIVVDRPPSMFQFEPPAPAQYVVPSRFGMSGIIGVVTALALLFGGFHIYNADPVFYLFFGTQAIVICVAQMLYGKTPRAASAISGAIFLPLFLAISMALWGHRREVGFVRLFAVLGTVPVGALVGYATGTLAAGVFLIMDAAERLMVSDGPAELGTQRR
jgi:hypothetical protein